MHITQQYYQNKPSLFLMNTEQQEYISLISRSTHDDILIKKTGWEAINFQEHAHEKFQIIYTLSGTLHVETGISLISRSTHDDILIKKTGWEAINFQEHAHEKFQIIYTLSGTLHVETGGVNYFVPEKHIAWIPEKASHKLSSNSRQVSLIIFYINLNITPDDGKNRFSIYSTNGIIAENLKFIASKGKVITRGKQTDLYNFALSFFNLLPQMTLGADFLLKTLVIPNDSRLHPILNYITEHIHEDLNMEQIASQYNLSVRNLSRLFNTSGIHPNDSRLHPILNYITEHIHEDLNMEQIASQYNLSVRNLSRLFNTSGIHFSSYVNHLRITRAIELLTDGDNTVQEVAYKVGFNTPNNFNRVFKQVTGKSPKTYIKGI